MTTLARLGESTIRFQTGLEGVLRIDVPGPMSDRGERTFCHIAKRLEEAPTADHWYDLPAFWCTTTEPWWVEEQLWSHAWDRIHLMVDGEVRFQLVGPFKIQSRAGAKGITCYVGRAASSKSLAG